MGPCPHDTKGHKHIYYFGISFYFSHRNVMISNTLVVQFDKVTQQ